MPLGSAHSPGAATPSLLSRCRLPRYPFRQPPPRPRPRTPSPHPPGTASSTGSRRHFTHRPLTSSFPPPGRRRPGLPGDPRRVRPLRAPGGARRLWRPRGGAAPARAQLCSSPPPRSGAGQAGPFLTQLCPGPPPSGRPPRGGLGAGGRVLGRGPRGGVSLRREGFGGHPKAEDHKQGHPGLLGTGHRGGLGGQGRCWGPWSECFGLSEPCQEQPTREVTGGYGKAPGVLSHQRKTWPVGLPPEGRTVSGKRTAGLDGTAVLGHV